MKIDDTIFEQMLLPWTPRDQRRFDRVMRALGVVQGSRDRPGESATVCSESSGRSR